MLFGHHKLDKTLDEYFANIGGLADDASTLIYLDTNILAYLYKLHTAARHEFFIWLDGVVGAERLAIPAWVASEYLSRVTSKGLTEFTPKSKEPSQLLKALEAMHETAALFVDEPLLRKFNIQGNRITYLNEFQAAIDSLRKCAQTFTDQFDPGHIHEEIVSHLATAILDSDLIELSNRAARNGASRYEHRLPPGFLDEGKDTNRFGDLIIWYEILDNSKRSFPTFSKILFITNDEKADWVYAPKMRAQVTRGERKGVGNSKPEIKIADPRLIAEFKRTVGHSDLTICSLAILIEAMSKVNASRFAQLAAAIQINTDEMDADSQEDVASASIAAEAQQEATTNSDVVVAATLPGLVVSAVLEVATAAEQVEAQVSQQFLSYDIEALHDNEYQVDAPTAINEVIKDLKSLNWYTQNPAIAKIKFLRDDNFTPSSWFVLGRNIYQAACGNSQKAMEFVNGLETQLEWFPEQTAQHLLAGMLYEIYFDSSGQFRRALKFAYADKPLSLVAQPKYAIVSEFMQAQLLTHARQLKFMPGDKGELKFVIVSVPDAQPTEISKWVFHRLQSIILDGVELLRPIDRIQEGQLYEGVVLTRQTIRDKLAEDLGLPRWALDTSYVPGVPPDVRFIIPESHGLYPKWALEGM